MATASEEFLVRFRYWLVIGGMITRSACGSRIRRVVWRRLSPSAAAASAWPRGTDWMPARTTSATKPDIIYALKSAFESGDLEILDAEVLEEMWFLRKNFIGITKSDETMTRHFDLVMAVAIAWEMRNHALPSLTERKAMYVRPKSDEEYRL